MTTVSIALCTYNGQQYLQDQLDSYSQQTRLPDELVVCDDTSTDNTVEILTEYARMAPFPVRLYRNEKQLGVIRNFEQATRLCEGEIIFFSDQDDVWNSTKIEKMIHIFDTRPEVGAVWCDAELVDENLQPLGSTLWQHLNFNTSLQRQVLNGNVSAAFRAASYMYGMSLAFRSTFRSVILPFGKASQDMGHDLWTARVITAMGKVSIIREPLVKYRRHSKNIGYWSNTTPLAVRTASIASVVVKHRRGTRHRSFEKRVQWFEEIRDRLDKVERNADFEASVRHIDKVIAHLQVRASLPSARLPRIPGAFKELLTLGYHRYSNGMRGFFRDLLERDAPVD